MLGIPVRNRRFSFTSPSERAVRRLGGEVGVVRDLEPIHKPQAALARVTGGDFHALGAHAFLLLGVGAGALGEETAVLGAEIARIPLPAAGVEHAHSTTGDHQVELVASDVATGVAHLDDHLFALDELGADVVGVVVSHARKLDAITSAAIGIGLGNVPVGETFGHGVGGFVVTGERASAVAGAGAIARVGDPILAALVAVGLRAVRLAAVPVARCEPFASLDVG